MYSRKTAYLILGMCLAVSLLVPMVFSDHPGCDEQTWIGPVQLQSADGTPIPPLPPPSPKSLVAHLFAEGGAPTPPPFPPSPKPPVSL